MTRIRFEPRESVRRKYWEVYDRERGSYPVIMRSTHGGVVVDGPFPTQREAQVEADRLEALKETLLGDSSSS